MAAGQCMWDYPLINYSTRVRHEGMSHPQWDQFIDGALYHHPSPSMHFYYPPGSGCFRWQDKTKWCKQSDFIFSQVLDRPLVFLASQTLAVVLSPVSQVTLKDLLSVIMHLMITYWKELVYVYKWINVWKLVWVPPWVWFSWSTAAYVGNHHWLLDSLAGTQQTTCCQHPLRLCLICRFTELLLYAQIRKWISAAECTEAH